MWTFSDINININDVNVEFFLCVKSHTKYFVYSFVSLNHHINNDR